MLRIQFEGWQCAVRENRALTTDRSETYMNRCLFLAMVNVRNSLCLSNIFIVEKPTVRHNAHMDADEGEPDVAVFFSEFGSNEPHAVIECKRLDPSEYPKQLRSRYVRCGIDRFIRGLYGRGHELDFMIGYVLRADEVGAMQDVNAYLQNVGALRCTAPQDVRVRESRIRCRERACANS